MILDLNYVSREEDEGRKIAKITEGVGKQTEQKKVARA